MEPHIDVITLAVNDLERSFEFYRDGLGLESCELVGTEYLGDGLMLMLYPRSELAKDANIAPTSAQSGEFSIGRVVPGREDVDALLARAEDAGATLTDRPHDRPWGWRTDLRQPGWAAYPAPPSNRPPTGSRARADDHDGDGRSPPQVEPIKSSSNADIQVMLIMGLFSLAFICIPFIPGVRELPRRIPLYKLIWKEHYRAQKSV